MLIGLLSFVCTVTTPLAPVVLTGTSLFAVSWGAAPVGTSAKPHLPGHRRRGRSLVQTRPMVVGPGKLSLGLGLGAAVAPPVVAWLMTSFGWQRALGWTTLPAVVFVAIWAWYARNTPREHRAVSPAELAELDAQAQGAWTIRSRGAAWRRC